MKLGIPENIKLNINEINQVFLEGILKDEVNFSNEISMKHVENVNFVELHDLFYNKNTNLRYKVVYKNNKTEYFTFASKEDALYKKLDEKKQLVLVPSAKQEKGTFPEQWIWHCDDNYSFSYKLKKDLTVPPDELMYQSKQSSFADTPEDRATVLAMLQEKYVASSNLSSNTTGTKNLIYYSVGGNQDWFDLFKMSLLSLIEQGNINYDVLVITTEPFKQKILEIDSAPLNLDFLIVPEPESNIELSINKLLIYQYEKLAEYNRVLFLDSDVIAARPFSQVFSEELDTKKLHTYIHSDFVTKHKQHAHVTPWHGIGVASNEVLVRMKEENQLPFNAGQFLFAPTPQMISHFENIHWFSKEWPQKYFFEQSLMTHYFCLNCITSPYLLSTVCKLLSVKTNIQEINANSVTESLIHFIGNSTNAENKLTYIKTYANLFKK
jgi:hypothetical protein